MLGKEKYETSRQRRLPRGWVLMEKFLEDHGNSGRGGAISLYED
jgi:hypothetical protein